MKKAMFAILLTFICLGVVEAQSYYQSAVGARLGSPFSASYKTFINNSDAIEAYAGFRSYGFGGWLNISAAYQIHQPLEDVIEGLQWYYGAGASVFFWNYTDSSLDGLSSTTLGLQGYLGLDYTLNEHPIQITVDWIPTIFIGDINVNVFGAGYGSLGIRYILER
jgi:hypothetical protein